MQSVGYKVPIAGTKTALCILVFGICMHKSHTDVCIQQNFTDKNSSHGDRPEVICLEDFYWDDGVCTPECGKWSIYSSKLRSAVNVLVIVSLAIGIIGGATVVILSLIRHKKMWVTIID